jgi:sulfonate transport system substrate-binding protein
LRESDVKLVNLDPQTAAEAVAQGQIDATFSALPPAPHFASLVEVIYTSGPQAPILTSQASFIVTNDFIAAHPEAVDRVTRVAVGAAHWASQEQNRPALYEVFGKTGYPPVIIKAAFDHYDLKQYTSPLWDDFATAQLGRSAADCANFGLIRTPVAVQGWINPGPLTRALAALSLTGYWPRYAADGVTRLG